MKLSHIIIEHLYKYVFLAHLHTQNEDLSLHKFGIPQLQKKKKIWYIPQG